MFTGKNSILEFLNIWWNIISNKIDAFVKFHLDSLGVMHISNQNDEVHLFIFCDMMGEYFFRIALGKYHITLIKYW